MLDFGPFHDAIESRHDAVDVPCFDPHVNDSDDK